MTHKHITGAEQTTGNESSCLRCDLPLIFTASGWQWKYAVDAPKRQKLRTLYAVREITRRTPL